MPRPILCPDADTLARFTRGRLPAREMEALAEHIPQCPACAAAVRALPAVETLAESAATPAPPAQGESALARPDPQEQSAGSVAHLTPLPSPSAPASSYRLAAAQRPDELGRLGPYRVLKLLGSGGMGAVFEAEDPQLGRHVALKVMKPALAFDPSASLRFLREARAMAAVEHEHIIAIHQVGEADGVPFLTMPLLRGESLEGRVKRTGRLPVADVLSVGRQAAEGLAAAHAAGLVHRDVKPANIFLVRGEPPASAPGAPRSPQVKILDFGLARAVADGENLTAAGVVVGTPAYMAPEQARGEAVDPRCDLFSLGCVLYHLGTGKPPFGGSDMLAVLTALATHQPVAPREINPEVPAALSDLVLRLLSRDPAGRPATAAEVARELAAIEQGQPGAAVDPAWTPRRPPDSAPPPAPARRAARWLYPLAAAAALLLTAGGAWLLPRFFFPGNATTGGGSGANAAPAAPQDLVTRVEREGTPLDLRSALPLLSGDRLRLGCDLPAGTEAALFWLDTRGKLTELRPVHVADGQLRFPAAVGKVVPLTGPAGTELVLVCASRSARPRLEELAQLLEAGPWPTLPPRALVRLTDAKVVVEGARGVGDEADTPLGQVEERLERLREQLRTRYDFVAGVAFPHYDQE